MQKLDHTFSPQDHPTQPLAHPFYKAGRFHLPLLAVLLVWLLSGLACAETPALVSSSNAPKSGETLFVDDFSKQNNGWGTWNRDGSSISYHNGGLRFLVNESQYDFWSVAGKNFQDVEVSVDATKLEGPDDNDYGLICRYLSKENFYMMVISSDGYYGIAKMKDGQYRMIGADQLQYSEVIGRGQARNRIQAVCSGPVLSLTVNGHLLLTVQDADFTSGDVGLLAGSYNHQGVDILFDNFLVRRPTGT